MVSATVVEAIAAMAVYLQTPLVLSLTPYMYDMIPYDIISYGIQVVWRGDPE
jgi:hypothetical protein